MVAQRREHVVAAAVLKRLQTRRDYRMHVGCRGPWAAFVDLPQVLLRVPQVEDPDAPRLSIATDTRTEPAPPERQPGPLVAFPCDVERRHRCESATALRCRFASRNNIGGEETRSE